MFTFEFYKYHTYLFYTIFLIYFVSVFTIQLPTIVKYYTLVLGEPTKCTQTNTLVVGEPLIGL